MTTPYVRHSQEAPTVMHYPPGVQQQGSWSMQQQGSWSMQQQGGPGQQQFTPLPASARVGWRFRLNLAFKEDIPPPLRGLMITFCVFLGLHVFVQFLNVVAAGAMFKMYPGVVVSAVFLSLVTSVCAYLFWYRPLYAAFRDRSGFDYACFVLVFFGQLAVYPAQFVGVVPMWPGFVNSREVFHTFPYFERHDSWYTEYMSIWQFVVAVASMECFLLILGFILYMIVLCFWNSPYYNPKRQ